MKIKLGIYGSAAGDMDKALPAAELLGKTLRNYSDKVILITGACKGLPYKVISEAAGSGIEIWGYSDEVNLANLQASAPDDDHSIYSKLEFVPESFPLVEWDRTRKKYRNIVSTANCDAGIILSGRWGTLNEFTNLIDFQKVIGVLTGIGGIADELPVLYKKINKAGQGKVIFDDDVVKLLEKVINEAKQRKS